MQSQPCPGSAAVVSISFQQTYEFLSNHDFLLPLAFPAQAFCDLLGTPADIHQGHVLSSWHLAGASDGGWWSINLLTPSRFSKR